MPGVRVVVRLGPERLLRAAAVLFLLAMVGIVAVFFPEFFDPTRIGGDVSNYYAAGQRLNAGHDLYAIQPGDRMGPPNPPYWTVPLLNPPPIAVLWRPLAALGDVAMYAWWIAAAVVSVITVAWLVRRSRASGLWLLILLSPAVALLCVAGNVGAFLFPVYGLIWWADRNDRPQIAGVAVAAVTAIKLTQGVFGWWLLVRRRTAAVGWSIPSGIAILAVSVIGAGWDSHVEFLSIAQQTSTTGVSRLSLAGIAGSWGLPHDLVPLVTPVVGVVCLALIWLLRQRPAASFAVAAAASVIVSPVVYFEQISLLVTIAIPFARTSNAPTRAPARPPT